MISFTSDVKFKYYFWANWYRSSSRLVEKLFMIFFAGMAVLSVFIHAYKMAALIAIGFPFFAYVFIPFLSYVMATYFYQIIRMEYYFDEEAFGLKISGMRIGGQKMELEKKAIKTIRIHPTYVEIKMPRQTVYFVTEAATIKTIQPQLLESSYKEYITIVP